MPTTVADAFATVHLVREAIVTVRWGTKPKTSEPDVHIVSHTESLDTYDGELMEGPLAAPEFGRWLDVRQELTLDRTRSDRRAVDGSSSALLDSRRGYSLGMRSGLDGLVSRTGRR